LELLEELLVLLGSGSCYLLSLVPLLLDLLLELHDFVIMLLFEGWPCLLLCLEL